MASRKGVADMDWGTREVQESISRNPPGIDPLLASCNPGAFLIGTPILSRPSLSSNMNRLTHVFSVGVVLLIVGMAACTPADEPESVQVLSPQNEFWVNLASLCESAAAGELLQAPDTQIDPEADLVVHFWECGAEELRFPLHVDDDRSRTWVFILHPDGIELRHDHRNADGTEEENTWYGAKTIDEGTANRQDFVMVRGEMTSGWRVEIYPGDRFEYGTARNGEWRHHLVFDLTEPVTLPPMHWGYETRPSQRPTISGE